MASILTDLRYTPIYLQPSGQTLVGTTSVNLRTVQTLFEKISALCFQYFSKKYGHLYTDEESVKQLRKNIIRPRIPFIATAISCHLERYLHSKNAGHNPSFFIPLRKMSPEIAELEKNHNKRRSADIAEQTFEAKEDLIKSDEIVENLLAWCSNKEIGNKLICLYKHSSQLVGFAVVCPVINSNNNITLIMSNALANKNEEETFVKSLNNIKWTEVFPVLEKAPQRILAPKKSFPESLYQTLNNQGFEEWSTVSPDGQKKTVIYRNL